MHFPNLLEKEIYSTVIVENFMRVFIIKMLLSLSLRVTVAKIMNACIEYYQSALLTNTKILKNLIKKNAFS